MNLRMENCKIVFIYFIREGFLGHFKKTKGCHYALSSNFQSHKYQTTDFFHMFDHLYVYYAKV